MAIYEYRCGNCGNEFEVKRLMSEMDDPAKCPRCQGKAKRLLSVFAASNLGVGIMVPTKDAFRAPAPQRKAQPATKKAAPTRSAAKAVPARSAAKVAAAPAKNRAR